MHVAVPPIVFVVKAPWGKKNVGKADFRRIAGGVPPTKAMEEGTTGIDCVRLRRW